MEWNQGIAGVREFLQFIKVWQRFGKRNSVWVVIKWLGNEEWESKFFLWFKQWFLTKIVKRKQSGMRVLMHWFWQVVQRFWQRVEWNQAGVSATGRGIQIGTNGGKNRKESMRKWGQHTGRAQGSAVSSCCCCCCWLSVFGVTGGDSIHHWTTSKLMLVAGKVEWMEVVGKWATALVASFMGQPSLTDCCQ